MSLSPAPQRKAAGQAESGGGAFEEKESAMGGRSGRASVLPVLMVIAVLLTGCGQDQRKQADVGSETAPETAEIKEAEGIEREGIEKIKESEETEELEERNGTAETEEERREGGRDPEAVREHLAAYSNEYEELVREPAYVIVHGSVETGAELWERFYEKVTKGESAHIDIIQFTTEGDAIILYLDYDGNDFYMAEDASRDAWGAGELYFEWKFPYLKVFEESGTNGDGEQYDVREIVLTDYEPLTLSLYNELSESRMEGEKPELPDIETVYVAYVSLSE